jgi:biopolymer transport protein ExbB
MPEPQNSELLADFVKFLFEDWFASIPIALCAIAILAVAIDRGIYYSRNQRDLGTFIRRVQQDLEQDNLDNAVSLSQQVGGLIGLMTEEGIRLMRHHAKNFSNAFDISSSLYVRDLERRLSILATIGATAPFLGLFGTVVGVIITLKLLGQQGGQSQAVVLGVAKALFATGFGLIVAIIAVVLNNWFNTLVRSFENDFQVIKLTLLDYINSQGLGPAQAAAQRPNQNLASSAQYYSPAGAYGAQPQGQQYPAGAPVNNQRPPQARIVSNPIAPQDPGYPQQ